MIPVATAIPAAVPPIADADLLSNAIASHKAAVGESTVHFHFDPYLKSGPHLRPVTASPPPWTINRKLSRLRELLTTGLAPLDDLRLHAAFPAGDMAKAIELLTSSGFVDHTGERYGLGRTMGDLVLGQRQYLIDLGNPTIFSQWEALSDGQVALKALRRIMQCVISSPGVGTVSGMLDALPQAGITDERHFWLRLSSGGDRGGNTPHFNTNSNPSSESEEACWHCDNPGKPTRSRTSRLIIKLYSAGTGLRPHRLQMRAPLLGLFAEAPVLPGDAIIMSDVARGSSEWSATPTPATEHRGCTPPGRWQLELLLTLTCDDSNTLHSRLRALAQELAAQVKAHGPTLADGGPLIVEPEQFRNHPLLAGTRREAVAAFSHHTAK
jgi:hypothetical protein